MLLTNFNRFYLYLIGNNILSRDIVHLNVKKGPLPNNSFYVIVNYLHNNSHKVGRYASMSYGIN